MTMDYIGLSRMLIEYRKRQYSPCNWAILSNGKHFFSWERRA